MAGFQTMLREIALSRPHKILMLGSMYDSRAGYGPLERPYEDQQQMLDKVAGESGTEVILIDPILGL